MAAERAEESLRSIEAGGLPVAARERLANVGANRRGFFTSDLSTQEFLLVREAGFRPVSQVMGSCFYTAGWQYTPGKRAPGAYAPEGQQTLSNPFARGFEYDSFGRRIYKGASFGQVFELETEAEAWQEGRRLALARLAAEARLAGANAVVGVSLRRGTYDWGRNVIEFIAFGTAVASERYDLGAEPVLSNLSGQDFAKLYANGYWPVGIAACTAVIYVMAGQNQRSGVYRFSPNQELQDFTQGVQHARRVAMSRLTAQAREVDAAGVVGLGLEVVKREHEHEHAYSRKFKDMVVTVHALGTAIAELKRPDNPTPVSQRLDLAG